MTFLESRLLRKLKKAQITGDGSVYIDFDAMTATTVHDGTQKFVTINLTEFSSSIRSILKSLECKGMIESNTLGYTSVNHRGWHAFQVTIQNAMKLTVRDVLVPIIVSIITVLLTELVLQFF